MRGDVDDKHTRKNNPPSAQHRDDHEHESDNVHCPGDALQVSRRHVRIVADRRVPMTAGPKREVTAPPLDLRGLPRSGARRVEAFASQYLAVTEGKDVRRPFRLRRWQLEIVRKLFPARGPPRQGLVSIARGNGKTSLAALLALSGLFADRVEGAGVVVASDQRQAGIILCKCVRMIQLSPLLSEQAQIFTNRIYVAHVQHARCAPRRVRSRRLPSDHPGPRADHPMNRAVTEPGVLQSASRPT
jgi:hypothetical protein